MPLSTVYIRFAAHRSEDLQRSPLLERLVARATAAVPVADWRADAYRALVPEGTPMPPIAAGALGAGPGAGAWVCIATPVHLSAGMSSVRMPRDGVLTLEAGEAEALAADFSRIFDRAGVRLAARGLGVLVCVFDAAPEVETQDPEGAAGHDVFEFLPAGRDGARLRGLMSEMEMWLFDHEINRARAASLRPQITGLWLWGGGEPQAAAPVVRGWAAGHDPFFSALGSESNLPQPAGAGVVVCAEQPGTAAWMDVEQRWLTPAVERLRSGKLTRVDLSAARRRLSLGTGPHLRFWRRPQPWWESFGAQRGVE
jgi:hypothetical protein